MECPRPVHPTSEHFSVQRPLFSVKCAGDGTGLPHRRRSAPGSGLPSFPMRPEITAEGRKASGEYTRPHNNRTARAAPLPCAVPHRWSWFRPAGFLIPPLPAFCRMLSCPNHASTACRCSVILLFSGETLFERIRVRTGGCHRNAAAPETPCSSAAPSGDAFPSVLPAGQTWGLLMN